MRQATEVIQAFFPQDFHKTSNPSATSMKFCTSPSFSLTFPRLLSSSWSLTTYRCGHGQHTRVTNDGMSIERINPASNRTLSPYIYIATMFTKNPRAQAKASSEQLGQLSSSFRELNSKSLFKMPHSFIFRYNLKASRALQ